MLAVLSIHPSADARLHFVTSIAASFEGNGAGAGKLSAAEHIEGRMEAKRSAILPRQE